QEMNISSLLSNIVLERFNGSQPCAAVQTTAWQRMKSVVHRLLAWMLPPASAQAEHWCQIPANIVVTQYLEGSRATVFPQSELAQNTQYRVRVQGDAAINDGVNQGVRSVFDVSMNGDAVSLFSTGEAKCNLDLVD